MHETLSYEALEYTETDTSQIADTASFAIELSGFDIDVKAEDPETKSNEPKAETETSSEAVENWDASLTSYVSANAHEPVEINGTEMPLTDALFLFPPITKENVEAVYDRVVQMVEEARAKKQKEQESSDEEAEEEIVKKSDDKDQESEKNIDKETKPEPEAITKNAAEEQSKNETGETENMPQPAAPAAAAKASDKRPGKINAPAIPEAAAEPADTAIRTGAGAEPPAADSGPVPAESLSGSRPLPRGETKTTQAVPEIIQEFQSDTRRGEAAAVNIVSVKDTLFDTQDQSLEPQPMPAEAAARTYEILEIDLESIDGSEIALNQDLWESGWAEIIDTEDEVVISEYAPELEIEQSRAEIWEEAEIPEPDENLEPEAETGAAVIDIDLEQPSQPATIASAENTLQQLCQIIESGEPEIIAQTAEIIERIMEIPARLEIDGAIIEPEAEAEIQELLAEFLVELGIDCPTTAVEYLSRSLLNMYLDGEIIRKSDEQITDDQTIPQNGTREIIFIKKLLAGLSDSQSDSGYAGALGGFALRLFALAA